MASQSTGIQNFDEMDDNEKSYVIKLIGIMIAAIIAGIASGIVFGDATRLSGWIGFGIFFAVNFGLSKYVQHAYDLREMSDMQVFRHGIAIGLLTYIFIWTVVFDFIVL